MLEERSEKRKQSSENRINERRSKGAGEIDYKLNTQVLTWARPYCSNIQATVVVAADTNHTNLKQRRGEVNTKKREDDTSPKTIHTHGKGKLIASEGS